MILAAKTVGVVAVLATIFDGSWSDAASIVVDVVALATIAGALTIYSRTKVALSVSESTARSWHEEKDAAVARADRLLTDSSSLRATIAVLENRPDLTVLQLLVSDQTKAMARHETSAETRADRIVAAIESLRGGI